MRFSHNARSNILSGVLASPTQRMIIGTDGSITMPDVYNDAISGTTRDLYIKDDGQLGYITSTAKDKENIQDRKDYSKIYELAPKTYDRKDGSVTGEVGLIAEEVVSVMPEIISYERTKEVVGVDKDGWEIIKYREDKTKPQTVNYSKLVVPLLIEVQKLKKQIEALSKEP
jgi:hypothetical protein